MKPGLTALLTLAVLSVGATALAQSSASSSSEPDSAPNPTATAHSYKLSAPSLLVAPKRPRQPAREERDSTTPYEEADFTAEAPTSNTKEDKDFNRWERRPWAMETVVGFSPYGLLGVAGDMAAAEWFVVNVGVGQGGSGAQYGITPRFRVPISNVVGIGLEGGISAGKYVPLCIMCEGEQKRVWNNAVWGNVGVVLDLRTGAGFHFRLFGGLEQMLNPEDCRYHSSGQKCTPRLDDRQLPYFGIALGYAFSR